MTMTRQHFEMIAGVLNSYWSQIEDDKRDLTIEEVGAEASTLRSLAIDFSNKLAETNPQFNPDKFLKACGVEGIIVQD